MLLGKKDKDAINPQDLSTSSQPRRLSQISQKSQKDHHEKHPFDDYQKLANLGKGAYGEVSLVKKKKDGKLFAMKVVKKEKVAQNSKMIEATLLE